MSGFWRRLFAFSDPYRYPGHGTSTGNDRPVGKNKMLAAGYGKPKLRKYKLEGKVLKESEAGTEVLASGGCIKEAESAQALKEAWERDMKIAFPMGPDYSVEYHCSVTPADDESDGDGKDDTDALAAAAAATAATTMF